MQVEFSAIHPDHILPLWKKIAPLFERLVNEQGSDSLENIFDSLVIKQHNLLWMAWEKDNLDNILMVISTRLVEGGIFEILGCVGQDRYLWMNYFSTLEQYAKILKQCPPMMDIIAGLPHLEAMLGHANAHTAAGLETRTNDI